MQSYDVYQDISERTNGSIFVAVVGPVRTGKSTLIAKIMDQLVLPNLTDDYEKKRIIDELPQSGAGRTIMTTQPKFVPERAVDIVVDENAHMTIRMIDCVGYLVEGAIGQDENALPRMVRTPWFDYDIPFEQAAEIGTEKVIEEHATVSVVVLADESVAGISRLAYAPAEEKVIAKLRENGKPFIIVLNSAQPGSSETRLLAEELQRRYDTAVRPMNIAQFTRDDMSMILSDLLYEFPIRRVDLDISGWVCALDEEHWLLSKVLEQTAACAQKLQLMRDFSKIPDAFMQLELVRRSNIEEIRLGEGVIRVSVEIREDLFYRVLGEECGCEIRDDSHLISIIKDLVNAKKQFSRVETAMREVDACGYGIVPPIMDELTLEEPELVQQGSKYGVRLRASAPSMHLIRVDVETEVSPLIGTQAQSQEFIDLLTTQFESDPQQGWATDIFGKSLKDVISDGLRGKVANIPKEAQDKLQETLQRMVNEGDGGMLCILL